MSLFIDKMFIDKVRFQLPLFSWERSSLAQFRCPFCGDSAKRATARRGYFYADESIDSFRFKCHNCGDHSGWTLGSILKFLDPRLAMEYNLEIFKESGGKVGQSKSEEWKPPKMTRTASVLAPKKNETIRLPERLLEAFTPLSGLPVRHYARSYAEDRLIPPSAMNLLGFVDNYQDLVKHLGIEEELVNLAPKDARLVIPLLSEAGELIGLQGRSFDPKAFLRYVSNKLHHDYPKVFGLHTLNKKKPILVVEGPLDSLFLPNCVATADSNLLSFKDGSIYIPDNQYRNFQICNIVEKIIQAGKHVCLFPPELWMYKDINEMVKDGGLTRKDLVEVILKNTYQGMKAKLIFSKLRGV